jgi:hypothetical protein
MQAQRAPHLASICDLYFDAREFGSNVNAAVMIYRAPSARSRQRPAGVSDRVRTSPMLDLLFVAIGLGFFAAGCLYLYACDRL